MNLYHLTEHQYTKTYLSAWVGGDMDHGGTYVQFFFEYQPLRDAYTVTAQWHIHAGQSKLNDYAIVYNGKDIVFGEKVDYEELLRVAIEKNYGFPGELI